MTCRRLIGRFSRRDSVRTCMTAGTCGMYEEVENELRSRGRGDLERGLELIRQEL